MKVLQFIDTLHPGGAEQIAVTFANALVDEQLGSCLCVTREEGRLKEQLNSDVGYLFLKKKGTFDIMALRRLKRFIRAEKIDIIHAHTTSYFFASLLKLIAPKITLIWHEHQGNRVHSAWHQVLPLLVCSLFFSKIITVNTELKEWCEKTLLTKKVVYLSNFVNLPSPDSLNDLRKDRIICVANLKAPKNHLNLLKAFLKVHHKHPLWELQLAGANFEDAYAKELESFCDANALNNVVHFMGGNQNVGSLLQEASIGVLSSNDEGLPMALLEYGAYQLVPVTTQVGDCVKVISTFGKTVPSKDSSALAEAILYYIENKEKRCTDAKKFQEHVKINYAKDSVLPQLIHLYKN